MGENSCMGLLCSVVLGSLRSCRTPSLNTLEAGRILAKLWACVYSVCTFQCTYMVHTTILSGSIPHSQLLLCQVKVQAPYCVNMWVCACLTSSVKYTLTLFSPLWNSPKGTQIDLQWKYTGENLHTFTCQFDLSMSCGRPGWSARKQGVAPQKSHHQWDHPLEGQTLLFNHAVFNLHYWELLADVPHKTPLPLNNLEQNDPQPQSAEQNGVKCQENATIGHTQLLLHGKKPACITTSTDLELALSF